MESFGDNVGSATAESGEFVDERSSGDREESAPADSLYGPGVPTAESFADDVPVEWLHEEDGSSEES